MKHTEYLYVFLYTDIPAENTKTNSTRSVSSPLPIYKRSDLGEHAGTRSRFGGFPDAHPSTVEPCLYVYYAMQCNVM